MSTFAPVRSRILYPDSDGQPMAENTRQAECMATLYGNLDDLFRDRGDVFVAMDNLWYPVEGHPEIRMAPDVYVVFGRPKGHRGSYRQFEEGDVPIQVVFEVLSPGNRFNELKRKFDFYEEHGVEEYYIYEPELNHWQGYVRQGDGLSEIDDMANWVSPRLGVRFDMTGEEMRLIRPDGQPFLTFTELAARARSAEERAERLAAKLRAAGLDPEG
jgi:Uma2 family endonuclease